MPILALIGYGRMGKEIEAAARTAGFKIAVIIDQLHDADAGDVSQADLSSVDVCIDFSSPDAVVANTALCAQAGKNIVVGTTGWEDSYGEVSRIIEEHGIGLIHAANYSVGVRIFTKLVEYASSLLRAYEQYDVAIQETHHVAKKDAPSGTALWLAQLIMRTLPRKTMLSTERPDRAPNKNELLISSSRVGFTPGEHVVVLDSQADTIALKHTARGRQGFAEGALLAASWIHGKQGIFSIEEMFDDIESI